MCRRLHRRIVAMLRSVHWISDSKPAIFHTIPNDGTKLAVDLPGGHPKQCWDELFANGCFQRRKELGSVSDHTLHVLPFILEAECEPTVDGLWVAGGELCKSLHRLWQQRVSPGIWASDP